MPSCFFFSISSCESDLMVISGVGSKVEFDAVRSDVSSVVEVEISISVISVNRIFSVFSYGVAEIVAV